MIYLVEVNDFILLGAIAYYKLKKGKVSDKSLLRKY